MPIDRPYRPRDPNRGQLLNYVHDSYLERTSRPVYAIFFLLPLIVVYEIGTLLINTDVLNQSQIRVVSFVWLQRSLEYLGYSGRLAWIAPPVVVIVILVGLQIASRKPWYFSLKDVGPMFIECVLLAIPLIVLCLFLNSTPTSPMPMGDNLTLNQGSTNISLLAAGEGGGIATSASIGLWADIITGIGAGIYEELVFRIILISLLMMITQDLCRMSHKNALVLSVLISAGLFSAHHHIGFIGGTWGQTDPFTWTAFGFRTMAGIYFAVLFAVRGFGITAGTHAFYDILAAFMNAMLSSN